MVAVPIRRARMPDVIRVLRFAPVNGREPSGRDA
jgi:hypothetical protein